MFYYMRVAGDKRKGPRREAVGGGGPPVVGGRRCAGGLGRGDEWGVGDTKGWGRVRPVRGAPGRTGNRRSERRREEGGVGEGREGGGTCWRLFRAKPIWNG